MDMRQYDPAIARWVVMDPVIHHSMSPYSSFDGSPVFWADPSGAWGGAVTSKHPLGIAVGGFIGGIVGGIFGEEAVKRVFSPSYNGEIILNKR